MRAVLASPRVHILNNNSPGRMYPGVKLAMLRTMRGTITKQARVQGVAPGFLEGGEIQYFRLASVHPKTLESTMETT